MNKTCFCVIYLILSLEFENTRTDTHKCRINTFKTSSILIVIAFKAITHAHLSPYTNRIRKRKNFLFQLNVLWNRWNDRVEIFRGHSIRVLACPRLCADLQIYMLSSFSGLNLFFWAQKKVQKVTERKKRATVLNFGTHIGPMLTCRKPTKESLQVQNSPFAGVPKCQTSQNCENDLTLKACTSATKRIQDLRFPAKERSFKISRKKWSRISHSSLCFRVIGLQRREVLHL